MSRCQRVQRLFSLGRIGEFVRHLEQACSQQSNRLMRTRMLGGVGGVRRNPAPIPIILFGFNLRDEAL